MKIGDLKSIPFSSSCNQVLVNNLWILIFRCKTSISLCVCLCFGSGLTKFPVECMNDFEGVFIQQTKTKNSHNYSRSSGLHCYRDCFDVTVCCCGCIYTRFHRICIGIVAVSRMWKLVYAFFPHFDPFFSRQTARRFFSLSLRSSFSLQYACVFPFELSSRQTSMCFVRFINRCCETQFGVVWIWQRRRIDRRAKEARATERHWQKTVQPKSQLFYHNAKRTNFSSDWSIQCVWCFKRNIFFLFCLFVFLNDFHLCEIIAIITK